MQKFNFCESHKSKCWLRDIEHPDIEHRDTQHPDIEHPGHWASKTLSIRTLSILGHWASETLSILGHWASRDIEHTGTLSIQGRHGARGSEMMFSRYIGNISILGTDIWAIYRLVGRIYRWCIDYFEGTLQTNKYNMSAMNLVQGLQKLTCGRYIGNTPVWGTDI